MESPEDTVSIYSKWILLLEDGDYQTDTILSLTIIEKQNHNALEWTIKKGGPPKIIKQLAPPELHQKLLRKARSNSIRPLKLLFKNFTIFDPFQCERIILYGLQESEKSNFTRGTLFFKKQQRVEKTHGPLMINTL